MRVFKLPDLGEGLTDAEIVSWHVAPGDHVVADQPLVSVETAKAVVEIPAPWSGRVVRTFGAPHEIIAIGATLVEIETEEGKDTGSVIGELPPPPTRAAAGEPAESEKAGRAEHRPVKASPAVRREAATLGIDLDQLTGTGPGGAITMEDLKGRVGPTGEREGFEPLRGVRRAMAVAMAKSVEIVSATVTDEAHIEGWDAEVDPTLRLIRAMVAGCLASPALNAWYDAATQTRRLHSQIDLGIAMEANEGLFVPVLRDVANQSPAALRAALEAAKLSVASRSISPADLKGQTITLSNFGMLGGQNAVLTILPPQVAILGAGRIYRAPRVVADKIEAVRILPLSLTFDHRTVTGAEACKFMSAVVADLSQ